MALKDCSVCDGDGELDWYSCGGTGKKEIPRGSGDAFKPQPMLRKITTAI